MSEQLNEYQTRLQRLEQLKAAGVIPYANKYSKTHSCEELISISKTDGVSDADQLMQEGATQTYSTAGRMMAFRTMGKLSFATIRDGTTDIQICFVKNHCSLHTGKAVVSSLVIADNELTSYKFAEKFLDIGDFVGVKGELFITKHGELTVFVNEYQLLSKALRPLGDKRNGIQDEEKIYRQRYLDMTMNEESYSTMLIRSKFMKVLREFYRSYNFIELDTPILGNSASGAAATPFKTRHEDFDIDMYLRIAPEIALKMATVGRLERVFEIGKDFRNEGSSPSHHQEFTVAEHYAAYWNYEDNIRFTEEMFDYLFDHIPELSRKVMIADKQGIEREVDFSTPWKRIDYTAQILADSGIDVSMYTSEDEDILRQEIQARGHHREGIEKQTTATMIDYLYKKVTRPQIIGPAFIYNYPKTMQPLARQSDENGKIVEQFQAIVNGREILKAYSELVDPVIQQANFDEQAEAVASGDDEATKADDAFITSMEHGMPPQSGRGMGIDRILSLLLGKSNIRDVIMFPLMKPLGGTNVAQEKHAEIHSNVSDNNVSTNIDYGTLPTIDQTHNLVNKYLTDTKRHCEQVGGIMQWFAKKLGEDEHLRYLAGVLHDIDRDYIEKNSDKHLKKEFDMIMDEINAPQALRDDIKSHGERLTGVPVDSTIRKYLASVDELSGFMYAYSLLRPNGFDGMNAKGVRKRIKDKSFAAGVDREHLKNCEKYLDIPLAEFIPDVLQAYKQIHTN